MIILDFLLYYLTYWFDKNKEKLSWSTPIQRATYAIGLMTMGFLYSFNEFLNWEYKSMQFNIPWFIYLIAALSIMKLYDYIYITKNRYEIISQEIPERFDISDDTGAILAMAIVALFVLSPFIVSTIVVPFGGHTINNK